MNIFELQPHPSTPTPFLKSLRVYVEQVDRVRMRLRFEASGDIDALEIPPTRPPRRTDELWRATCFEAFLRDARGAGYDEWNFSPSGEWAAYRFDDYRAGMTALALPHEPTLHWQSHTHRCQLEAIIARVASSGPVHLALSAVLRDRSGKTYYWALRHAPGKPDFHHAAGFAGMLDGAMSG